MEYKNHYDFLDHNFMDFFHKVCEKENITPSGWVNEGIISAHGDKCYSYESKWNDHNIPFERGVAIYLLTHTFPLSKEVRDTDNGWVDVSEWVINNYNRFSDCFGGE